jgi:hypothetical protein
MKQPHFTSAITLCLLILAALNLAGQPNCELKPPVIHIDFGSGDQALDPNTASLDNYRRIFGDCPQDGHYAITSFTSDCHYGHWITLAQDHTPGDNNGKLLLVNASYPPGLFFEAPLKGVAPNTRYELGAWLVNVCKPEFECTNIRPNLRFVIVDANEKELATFSTGEITPTGQVSWLQYSAMFTTPSTVGDLSLRISDKADGGCGNDFALDDITIRECIVPKPVPLTQQPRPITKPSLPVKKAPAKPGPPVLTPAKKIVPTITGSPVKDSPVVNRAVIRERAAFPLPKPIASRANPIVKQIETVESEISIDLYDNGEIDGDTVSIYHNNLLVVSRAALSAKPVSFHIKVDEANPHHELVMVANNLGSIPPNTSLMIITAKGKRYEVFISSSEQKNAKVVIDLKAP